MNTTSFFLSLIRFSTNSIVSMSKWLVGSSNKRISASEIKSLASSSLDFSPPLRVLTLSLNRSFGNPIPKRRDSILDSKYSPPKSVYFSISCVYLIVFLSNFSKSSWSFKASSSSFNSSSIS